MTRRDNQLRSNATSFAVQLSADLLGAVACRMARITVDPKVGPEVVLLFTDTPVDARRMSELNPLGLIGSSAVVPTPYGTIGAIVWQIAPGTRCETFAEQYIAPGETSMMALLREAAEQTHLKLVILDNRSSEVRQLVDLDNEYRLDELVAALDARAGEAAPDTFAEAVQYARANARLIDKTRAAANPGA